MRPSIKFFLFLFILATIAAGCSSVTVSASMEEKADFESPKTYSFYPWDASADSLLMLSDRRAIEGAIRHEMERRGIKYVEKGGDLTVSVFIILNRKTAVRAYTDHYGPGYYYSPYVYGPYYYGPPTTVYTTESYVEGTMLIDVLNTAEKKVIWQGKAVGEVNRSDRHREKNLPKVIKKIFYLYPKKPISY